MKIYFIDNNLNSNNWINDDKSSKSFLKKSNKLPKRDLTPTLRLAMDQNKFSFLKSKNNFKYCNVNDKIERINCMNILF